MAAPAILHTPLMTWDNYKKIKFNCSGSWKFQLNQSSFKQFVVDFAIRSLNELYIIE